MKFTASRKVKTLIPAHETVHEFARVGSEMKKAGRALSHHDLWIATQAIQNNLTLVTYDKDFIHVKDAGIKGFKLQFLKV
jgi:predicted nucleic acid-binding protein